jgi:hypothetical protein
MIRVNLIHHHHELSREGKKFEFRVFSLKFLANFFGTHPTEARDRGNFLNSSMNCHPMPLMIVESHASRLDVHFLLAVCQSHRQRDSAVANRQIQIVGAVTCANVENKIEKNCFREFFFRELAKRL